MIAEEHCGDAYLRNGSGKPARYVAGVVFPALLAISVGTLAIVLAPATAYWLPHLLLQ
jgi:hypothetical protein